MGYETVRLGLADPGRSVDEREPAFVGRSHLPPVRPADESSLGAAASVAAETPHPVTRRRRLLSTHATSRGVGHLHSACGHSAQMEERDMTEVTTSADVHGGPRFGDVIGAALRTYRERFWRVAGTAFIVFGAVAAIDAFATVLVIDRHVSRPYGAAITSAASAVFSMVGVVVYAGILDKVVGAHLHGHPDLGVGDIWRVLPFRRLVAADVVLALATLAGLALFVVPGVLIFTLWSLVGPVITIEDRAVGSALA